MVTNTFSKTTFEQHNCQLQCALIGDYARSNGKLEVDDTISIKHIQTIFCFNLYLTIVLHFYTRVIINYLRLVLSVTDFYTPLKSLNLIKYTYDSVK